MVRKPMVVSRLSQLSLIALSAVTGLVYAGDLRGIAVRE
jgi:hypothetical protein